MKSIRNKSLSLILVIVMLLTMVIPAYAGTSSGTSVVHTGAVNGLPGATVSVPVYVSATVPIGGCTVLLTYDTTKLTPTSLTTGPLGTSIGNETFNLHYTIGGGDRVYMEYHNLGAVTASGEILATVNFTINSAVSAGTEISVLPSLPEIYDNANDDLATASAGSFVTVQSTNTVIYNSNGADSGTVPTDSSTYLSGTNVTLAGNTGGLAKAGYTFSGWRDNNAGTGTAYAAGSSYTSQYANMNFYAEWTISQYTVTFNSNSGSAVTAITQNYNTSVAKPTDPTRVGYTFGGWYTDTGLSSAVTWPYTPLTANVTLYAKWTANPYVVTYDANGGSVGTTTQTKLFGSTYGKGSNGTTVEIMPTPTRTSYTFNGWYTALSSGTKITDADTVAITAATTLYAIWTVNTYVVTYDPQGGTVSPTTQTKMYGSTYGKGANGTTAEVMPTPTRAGYTFEGWYTAVSGGGTEVVDTDTVSITSAITLYADWTANTYIVTYDPQSGTVTPTTQTKLYASTYGKGSDGTTAEVMPTPARTGYTFSGWFTAVNGGGTKLTDTDAVAITAATTLYAYWTTNTYVVTFNPQSGTVTPATQTKMFGATYGKGSNGTTAEVMPTPTRAGYTFGGWYTGMSGSGTKILDTDTVAITAALTLYAKWTANTYVVTYDPQSGTVSPTTQTKLYDSTYGKGSDGTTSEVIPTPTRTGYTFSGWYTAVSGGGTKITDTDTVAITTATTLYAKWTGNNYVVTYDPQSGTVTPTTQTKMYGSTYGKSSDGTTAEVMPTPTRTGYTFSGWYTAVSGGGTKVLNTDAVAITSATIYYASWTVNTYVVTFDPQSGTVSPTTQTKMYGSTYGNGANGTVAEAMPTPTRTGYTFEGWYTAVSGGGTEIIDTDTVSITAATTLYADWTANAYVVTYDPQTGTVSPTTQTKLYASTYGKGADGTTVEAMPTPTRTGYNFYGWYTAVSGGGTKITDTDAVSITAATTLYASWTVNTYVVTYNPQSGTVTATTQTKLYGSTYGKGANGTTAEVMPTPTRTGYTFAGWYTAVSGGGTKISDTDTVAITVATTLYANWTANQYAVTYDANGGAVGTSTQTKLFGSTYGKAANGTTDEAMPTPTQTGYNFQGWYTAATGGTLVTDATVVAIASNHTLYAQWSLKSYELDYDGNNSTGGLKPSPVVVKYNASTVLSGNSGSLVKTSVTTPIITYVFAGWNTASNGSGTTYWPGMSYKMGAADVTLYARWTAAATYTVTYDGNGNSSGTAPAYVNNYLQGDTVTALDNLSSLAKTGYTFNGWNTKADGTGTGYAVGATFTMNTSNVVLYATWTTGSSGGAYIDTTTSKPTDISNTDKIISQIKGTTSEIDAAMTDASTVVSSDVFSALKETDKRLAITGTDYTWIANGKEITDPTAFSKYDLGVNFLWELKKEINTIPAGILAPKLVVEFSIKHSGALPGTLYLQFNSGLSGDKTTYYGKTLYFYTKNETTGKFDFISTTTVGSDGSVKLPFTHASTYLLTETMILTDIENHWAYSNIMDMLDSDIVNGNGSGLFEPDKSITRAEFAKMIATAFDYESNTVVTQFSDVNSSDWYAKYVTALYQKGILNGLTSTTFGPNESLTREQMAAILYRVIMDKNYSLTSTSNVSFTDQRKIRTYAVGAVQALTSSGIISGMGHNLFEPDSKATKAQIATLLDKALSKLK